MKLFGAYEVGKRLGRHIVSIADDRRCATLIGFEGAVPRNGEPREPESL
jgi:hypothetical protein